MKIFHDLFQVALIAPLFSIGMFASDRFGYTVNLPKQKTTIVITCKDIESQIIKDPGFKALVKPIGEIVAGSSDRFPENRTYFVFVRLSRGRLYCHADEEPIGDHQVVEEFSFSRKQWKSEFLEKVFRGILGRKELPRKTIQLTRDIEQSPNPSVRIEIGPVPGQPLESWSVNWR